MNKKAIIFDFDGAIADTLSAGVEIYNKVAKERGYRTVTNRNKDSLRSMTINGVAKELNVPFSQIPSLALRIKSDLKKQMSSVAAFEGIPEVLFELKKRGYQIGILTNNIVENVSAFLTNNILPELDFIYSSKGLFGKDKKLIKIMAEYKLSPGDILYVGDEVRDIQASQKCKIDIAAVTWGMNSKSILAAARPTFIVDKPQELLDIL